jgi:AAA domain
MNNGFDDPEFFEKYINNGGSSPETSADPDATKGLAPSGQADVKSAGGKRKPEPRQWLLGTTFCRGFLSGLTGAGAAGKTALRLLQLIALALGRNLTGEHVFRRTKALIVCLEDDEDELERRIWAACIHHNIDKRELDGWLYYWTPRDLRLLEVDQRGNAEPGGLSDALRHIIKSLGIGLVSIDPFVKSHGANENDNNLIDQAASLLLQVGHECGAAPDYVHHHKKGVTIAGDQDSGRGASALGDASRLVKTVSKMTAKEADELGVEDAERKHIIRLDDAKLNIAAPADEAMWFRLVGVDIGNATEDYPSGDNVQTVERWYPPQVSTTLAKSALVEIFDALRAGPEPGEFFLVDVRANGAWAGWPICKLAEMGKGEAKRLLRDWIKNGVLIESEYNSPQRKGREVIRVTLNEAKAAEIMGSLYRPPTGS